MITGLIITIIVARLVRPYWKAVLISLLIEYIICIAIMIRITNAPLSDVLWTIYPLNGHGQSMGIFIGVLIRDSVFMAVFKRKSIFKKKSEQEKIIDTLSKDFEEISKRVNTPNSRT